MKIYGYKRHERKTCDYGCCYHLNKLHPERKRTRKSIDKIRRKTARQEAKKEVELLCDE
jgi:NAD-dependent oxidoreductase involved in siderophore biosynthesis